MLWEVDIYPRDGQPDQAGESVSADAVELGFGADIRVRAARSYLIQGELEASQLDEIAGLLLVDPVVERAVIAPIGDEQLHTSGNGEQLLHVLPKPGVTDAVAESAKSAIETLNFPVEAVGTLRKYWIANLGSSQLPQLAAKLLANDSIEQVVIGPLSITELQVGKPYLFELQSIQIRQASDDELLELSKSRQLSMTLPELKQVQDYYRELDREPTDIELETVAQTWSEHCSHKTLAGRIAYRDERGERRFENMLKETIFAATQAIRKSLGSQDWCVSVFKDNAGIIRFDEQFNLAFKVETHNRPSALEPYGGANTGIGGVIRDTLGTGLGARPIANTDVFCFADPQTPSDQLPAKVLHPKRIMHGVVSGVRDYGNRMGIPTVNGAIYFDQRYVGNPLVFCGNVGILPLDMSFKRPQPGDLIVVIGGRTGRDGIHGATFSSAELTSESEALSGGAVQIGNAITEKMVTDVLLQARDEQLFHAVTDCGAGGFSSAVGEMGEEIGAEVWLEKAPLKYEGLSYTEIWISEAQERMVFAVPEANWNRFHQLCADESVEATVIGRFEPTGRLVLKYHEHPVGDIEMRFLHHGRPPVIRDAVFTPPTETEFQYSQDALSNLDNTLHELLQSPNIASKEWVIRQYDHEVLGGSVIKPLVGVENDGPSDAAVIRPRLESYRGAVISCGMNPYFGDFDPYHMAAGAIDEAIRNAVAVGADPSRIAILDNFCWGYTDRPETLGTLVRAALACHDLAQELKTPFISGKDSLNNEYRYETSSGESQTIAIPSTLLISALGQTEDVRKSITMDLKQAGNRLFQVGATKNELGGSHLGVVGGGTGGHVPQVDPALANQIFRRVHEAIQASMIRSCHDLSEGGLAVALAEMAFAGGWGAEIDLQQIPIIDRDASFDLEFSGEPLPTDETTEVALERDWIRLFSESNTRFVCEVAPEASERFLSHMSGLPVHELGSVTESQRLVISGESTRPDQTALIDCEISRLKETWQSRLNWH